MFRFTEQQQATLREYLTARNQQNWGLWPDVSEWPVPEEAGNFTASQYAGNGNDTATIIKFDRAVQLADGTRCKRVGRGTHRGGVPEYTSL